jgi:hypothetical protein
VDDARFGGPAGDDELPEADRDLVDDPDALRRAEEEVAHAQAAPEKWVPTDTVWVPVATAATSAAWTLAEVHDVLEGEGIPARYDPHDPREAFSLPYGLPREYAVIVPEVNAVSARRLVADLAAGGAAWSPVEGAQP